MYFTFIDKENLCEYKDGKITSFACEYVKRYREGAIRDKKNREWKKNSDLMLYEHDGEENFIHVDMCAISPTPEKNKLLYAFSVNDTSGIYYKFTDDEKKTEAHVLTSNEEVFKNICVHENGDIFGVVQRNIEQSSLATFSKSGGDYKTLTAGDSKDENPFFYQDGLYFNSYGIGRDANNNFVAYAPSEILKLNLSTMEIETVLFDKNFSYIKPVFDREGNLYCIQKPAKEKEESGIFSLLLIPVRILEAIGGFISVFVKIFAGKPLIDGKGKKRNQNTAVKEMDERKIFIHNQMLSVEKELKKNEKEEDAGFIPHSMKLVKFSKNADYFNSERNPGMGEVLASGVADFCITSENQVVYTNGKRIFSLTEDGKRKKLANVDFCIHLSTLYPSFDEEDLFTRL